MSDDVSIAALKDAVLELTRAVAYVREHHVVNWQPPEPLPADTSGWNFVTFEKFINQRFSDFSLQLRERYEAQQTGVTAALAAAEKAVTAALIAAEKAVDKAESAQQLRNEAQNEFRSSLSDLSKLMWTTKEGTAAIDSIRREWLAGHETIVNRTSKLETWSANIQGRIWAVSALWAIAVVGVSIALKFVGH